MSLTRKISDDERRLQAAAIRFASDYGPLPAALQGDPEARAKVADRLADVLMAEGFKIIPPSQAT